MEVFYKQTFSCPVPAEVAEREIQKVKDANGGSIGARDLVDAARPKRSPLHKAFEWDDKLCGELHRQRQAQDLMKAICYVVPETKRVERKYQSVVIEKQEQGFRKGRYMEITDIMSEEDLRSQLLTRALSELASLQRRYRHLQELAGVFRAIEDALQNVND